MNDTNEGSGRKTPIAGTVDGAVSDRMAAQLRAEACAEQLREFADRIESGEIPMQFGVIVYVAPTSDGSGELHAKGVNDAERSTPEIVGMLSMAANRIGELRQ